MIHRLIALLRPKTMLACFMTRMMFVSKRWSGIVQVGTSSLDSTTFLFCLNCLIIFFCFSQHLWIIETSNTGTVIQYQLPNCQGSSTLQPVADENFCSGSPNPLYARAGCAPSGAFTSPSAAPTTSSASSDSSSSSSGPSAGVIAGAVIGTLAGVALIAGIVYLVMFTNYFTAQKPLAAQSEKATEITA